MMSHLLVSFHSAQSLIQSSRREAKDIDSIKRILYISIELNASSQPNRVFRDIPPRLRVIIPKPIVAKFYLRIVILSLILERTPKILFSKALSGVAIEVLLAFPY